MPRVLLERSGSSRSIPASLAIRTESLADLIARQNVLSEIHGAFGAGLRQALISDEANHRFLAVERLGYRGFLVGPPTAERVEAVIKVRELWRARKRDFSNDAEGVAHALDLQRKAIHLSRSRRCLRSLLRGRALLLGIAQPRGPNPEAATGFAGPGLE